MAILAEELASDWRSQIGRDCPTLGAAAQESIVRWLLGEDVARFEHLPPIQLEIAKQAMDYRYRILRQRYLGMGRDRAYRSLIQRLSSLFLIRNKIRTWVALSRDRQRTVVDVLQEVIQELLQSDRYMQQQIVWIAKCTQDSRLRDALVLASTEEYCLRPIRSQPLLVYRFVNYLRRSQRGGMTQVPGGDFIRLVSDEVMPDESEGPVSLMDTRAITQYQEEQEWEEQQVLRNKVKQEFESYLSEKVGAVAAQWLKFYLQGYSQDVIARKLNLPVNEVYRLREKINYHAIRVFALKSHPELVASWLEISLKEHSLGLTPEQWQTFWQQLNAPQRQIVDDLKNGSAIPEIAQRLNMKPSQTMGEWIKIYLQAQKLRGES